MAITVMPSIAKNIKKFLRCYNSTIVFIELFLVEIFIRRTFRSLRFFFQINNNFFQLSCFERKKNVQQTFKHTFHTSMKCN